MKNILIIIYLCQFVISVNIHAQAVQNQVDLKMMPVGTLGPPGSGSFEIIANSDMLFSTTPQANEISLILRLSDTLVSGDETFTVINSSIPGVTPVQTSFFSHSDNFTYFELFVDADWDAGITLGVGVDVHLFTILYSDPTPPAVPGVEFMAEIADANTQLFADFAIRTSINMSGINIAKGIISMPKLSQCISGYLVLNDIPLPNGVTAVTEYISSAGIVESPNLNVTFQAVDSVVLMPNFEVKPNAIFEIIMEGCP